MKCPKCEYENREGAKFCLECGAKLENLCPKCGAKLPSGAKFCDDCGTKVGESGSLTQYSTPRLEDMHSQLQSMIPESLAQKYIAAEQQAIGENRPITVLFADISGFTPLSNTKPSEYMFQLVQDCFKQLVNIVAKYEGSISGFRGDGLLALFGAPILHENDAERAILSSIDMRNAMHDGQLEVSIGINTAMMTVGEIQTDLHKEYTAYGTDINLAKRLQEYAKPGQIMVGSGTHRLTRRAFDYDEMPSLELKGFTQPVTAYLLDKPKPHPEKLRGIEGLRARMVGRDREFEDLIDSTDTWLNGKGQIVTIIGEAGIGKSRLVSELKAHIESSDTQSSDIQTLILEGRCISIGQPISYWPFLDILRSWFDLAEDDSEAEVAGKVKEKIGPLMPDSVDDMLPFLGHLMNLKFGGEIDERLNHYSPEQIKHGIMTRLRDIFEALSQDRKLMLILEDLHWADDLSLDLISLLMDELIAHPIMLVCVYRPEQAHNVYRLSNTAQRKCPDRYRKIELSKLSSGESRRLVSELLAIDNLPDSVRDMILAKSEGNPFFIEEVIRSMMERGLVYKENDRWVAREDVIDVQVPDTIQSVLLERIDRLEDEAKYVLQCASVIGRLFKHRLLEHVSQKQRELDGYLDQFEERDLVYPERTLPEMEYAFKHALTQEATYQGILEQRRMAFHRSVALGIERLYQERIEEFYEELAHHWEIGGDKDKTLEYLMKAGDKATKQYLNDAAIDYYTHALDLAREIGIARDGLAEIYEKRGVVYSNISFCEEAISDMMEAASRYSQRNKRANMYQGISMIYHFYIADGDEAYKYVNKALEEFEPADKSRETVHLYERISIALIYSIDVEKGEDLLRKAISISEEMDYKDILAYQYSHMLWRYIWRDPNSDPTQLQRPDIDKIRQMAWEKANLYLPYGKSNLVDYSHTCAVLSWCAKTPRNLADNDEHLLSICYEAMDSGIKSGNVFAAIIAAESFYYTYLRLGKPKQALDACEKAMKLAIQVRYIYPGYMPNLIDWVTGIYVLDKNWSKILDIALQVVDSTFVLHGKPQTHSTVQKRWNEIAQHTYARLLAIAPDAYRDLIHELELRLNDSNSDGEKFFHHGQLLILATMGGDLAKAELHSHKLLDLRPHAGSFAVRIPDKVHAIIELLGIPADQRQALAGKLLRSIGQLDDFLNLSDFIGLVISKDEMIQALDWEYLAQFVLANIQKQSRYNVIDFWIAIERFYRKYNRLDNLQALALDIHRSMPDALQEDGVTQLTLTSVESVELNSVELIESFHQDPVTTGWKWIAPSSNCSYEMLGEGLQIDSLPGRNLWRDNFTAPRLLRTISGDFIIETRISDGSNGKKSGGLIMWENEDKFIRFEMPSSTESYWENTIYMGANVVGRFLHSCVHSFEVDIAWLRLERKGNRFTGYVSSDGDNWYSCGWVDMNVEDPMNVGIHALCPISPATSTKFEYVKIYRPNG